jgi:hypothetical protein
MPSGWKAYQNEVRTVICSDAAMVGRQQRRSFSRYNASKRDQRDKIRCGHQTIQRSAISQTNSKWERRAIGQPKAPSDGPKSGSLFSDPVLSAIIGAEFGVIWGMSGGDTQQDNGAISEVHDRSCA